MEGENMSEELKRELELLEAERDKELKKKEYRDKIEEVKQQIKDSKPPSILKVAGKRMGRAVTGFYDTMGELGDKYGMTMGEFSDFMGESKPKKKKGKKKR